MNITNDYLKYIEHHLPRKIKSLQEELDSNDFTPTEKVNKYLEHAEVKGMWNIYQRLKSNECFNL